MTAKSNASKKLTVYFDGACPLCTVEINHYAKQAGADGIAFIDVSREEAETGQDLSVETARRRFHIRKSDGTLLSGARGFVEIWQVLPRWGWAARLARIPGVVPVLELGYLLFLPIRPVLSRLAARLGARPANNKAVSR